MPPRHPVVAGASILAKGSQCHWPQDDPGVPFYPEHRAGRQVSYPAAQDRVSSRIRSMRLLGDVDTPRAPRCRPTPRIECLAYRSSEMRTASGGRTTGDGSLNIGSGAAQCAGTREDTQVSIWVCRHDLARCGWSPKVVAWHRAGGSEGSLAAPVQREFVRCERWTGGLRGALCGHG